MGESVPVVDVVLKEIFLRKRDIEMKPCVSDNMKALFILIKEINKIERI